MEPAPRWTLLVNPPYQQNVSSVAQTTVGPPMGLAYLAGALDHSGHPVTVLDANALGLSVEATVREAWARAPAVVGLTATTATIDLAARIALDLRHAGFEGPILVGGPHPTALPLETLRDYPAFSVAVAGEAEGRIGPLVDALEKGEGLDEIAGLVYRDPDGELHETGPASDHPEPDTLAPPARHLLPLDRYFCPDGRDAMSVIANRGCPAPCTYCLVPQHFGHRIRRRDPAAVADEIAELHATYGTRWINFIDDTFTWDADWVYAICNAFEVRDLPRRIQWQCLTRVDGVTPALLQRMRRAGCARIEMGIECASPEGIRMLRKRIDEHQVLNAFAWSRAVGLETLAFAMVNVPGETLADIDHTLRLLIAADPDYLQLSYCTPYPGTRLYDDAVAEGRLRTRDWAQYRFLRRPVLDNGVLTEQEVVDAHRRVLRRFWLRPRVIGRMVKRVASKKGARATTLRAAFHGLAAMVGG